MSSDPSRSLDLLGIKPLADSVNKLTSAVVDGSAAFLSRICLPAAEEFGELLRDRVHHWRAQNLAETTRKAEEKLEQSAAGENVHAHPRLVSNILEEASWIDDSRVQDFWAGLLASSCTSEGDDDSNMIFVNILSLLTKLQARIIDYACMQSPKHSTMQGLIHSGYLSVSVDTLKDVTGETDIQRLDRELDHLRELGLIVGGIHPGGNDAVLTPAPLAHHLYVRCQGSRASPTEYFSLQADPGTERL
jgi:hypothetical protein